MNRKLLLFLAAALATLNVSAQKINVGIRGDFTYSRINGDGMSIGYQAGFNAGGFAEYRIKDRWSIQPEILFSQRNIKIGNFKQYFASSASEDPGQYAFLSYVSVPVSVKYKILNELTVSAGVQYSYLVHADETLLRDKSDGFKKNDFGLLAGLEYTPSRLRFYGRYYRSVTDINNINDLHTWYTTQIQVGVGYILFAKK
jgi:hypothetical protein